MHVKCNSLQVIDARITLVLSGVWAADLSCHATEAITGAAQITIAESIVLNGTIMTPAADQIVNDRAQLRILGGAGKLQTSIAGKAYYSVPARIVLADMLASIGETLDPTSDAAALNTMLGHWCIAAGKAQTELGILLTRLSVSWRVTPAGLVWIGTDTWPESALAEGDYTVMEDDPRTGIVRISSDVPTIYPGETWREKRVQTVTHQLTGPTLRTEVALA